MTAAQITEIIDEIGGYSPNQIIPLTEVTAIVLNSNQNIYPSDTLHVKFNNTYDYIESYYGYTDDEGVFHYETHPRAITPYKTVQTFMLLSLYHNKTPYKSGASI